ncbi:hypothetical protein HC776_00230 [bacterium]|nr:hypothetical protein [bacterium]
MLPEFVGARYLFQQRQFRVAAYKTCRLQKAFAHSHIFHRCAAVMDACQFIQSLHGVFGACLWRFSQHLADQIHQM